MHTAIIYNSLKSNGYEFDAWACVRVLSYKYIFAKHVSTFCKDSIDPKSLLSKSQ